MSPHMPFEQSCVPLRSLGVHVPSGALTTGLAPLRLCRHIPSEGNSVPSDTHKRSMSPHVPTGKGWVSSEQTEKVSSLPSPSAGLGPLGPSRKVNVSSPALRADCVPSDASGLGVRPNIPSKQRSDLLGLLTAELCPLRIPGQGPVSSLALSAWPHPLSPPGKPTSPSHTVRSRLSSDLWAGSYPFHLPGN